MRRALFVNRFAEAEGARGFCHPQSGGELPLELRADDRRQRRAANGHAQRIAEKGQLEQKELPSAALMPSIPTVVDRGGDHPIPRARFLGVSRMTTANDG